MLIFYLNKRWFGFIPGKNVRKTTTNFRFNIHLAFGVVRAVWPVLDPYFKYVFS